MITRLLLIGGTTLGVYLFYRVMKKFWVTKRMIKDEIDHLIEQAYIRAQIALAKDAKDHDHEKEVVNEKVAVGKLNVLQELRHVLTGSHWTASENLAIMRKLALGDLKDGRKEKDKT